MAEYQIAHHTLEVPGARLYYETKGAGPLLLLIPGANGENTIFQPIRQYLAGHFTVVTYDRRGFSKSELVGDQDYEHRLDTDADDVRRLIEHLSDKPAIVFGSSSGAIVALQVLIKHPKVVHTLVAHEPPAFTVLPDVQKWRGFVLEVYDTYKKSGVKAGLQKFVVEVKSSADGQMMEKSADGSRGEYSSKNSVYWFEHELRQYPLTNLDIDTLSVHANRLILACGIDVQDGLAYLPNTVLAKTLKKEIFHVPGGHLGYFFHPEQFANTLLNGLKKRGSHL